MLYSYTDYLEFQYKKNHKRTVRQRKLTTSRKRNARDGHRCISQGDKLNAKIKTKIIWRNPLIERYQFISCMYHINRRIPISSRVYSFLLSFRS